MPVDSYGISPEERDQLQPHPGEMKGMDVKTSLLAFVGLLLICALIILAAFIANSREDRQRPRARPAGPPSDGSKILREVRREVAFSCIGKYDNDELPLTFALACYLESGPASRSG